MTTRSMRNRSQRPTTGTGASTSSGVPLRWNSSLSRATASRTMIDRSTLSRSRRNLPCTMRETSSSSSTSVVSRATWRSAAASLCAARVVERQLLEAEELRAQRGQRRAQLVAGAGEKVVAHQHRGAQLVEQANALGDVAEGADDAHDRARLVALEDAAIERRHPAAVGVQEAVLADPGLGAALARRLVTRQHAARSSGWTRSIHQA